MVHHYLKPENIQVDDFGEVLVCDWGLGKVWQPNNCDSLERSRIDPVLFGVIKGTPGYMAPEQINGSEEKNFLADIFSLGCLLHLIITGESPFKGSTKEILKATNGSYLDPSTVSRVNSF